MKSKINKRAVGAQRVLLAAVIVAALALDARQARAASPCPLGFLSGTAPTIDGTRSATEWNDASLTASGGGCFDHLLDIGAVGMAENRTVKVYSKRYTRGVGASMTRYLGFFFEIPDQTRPTSGPLPNGERIIIQLDPNFSGGTVLQNGAVAANKDWRIVIRHDWFAASADPNLLVPFDATSAPDGVQLSIFDGSGTPGICMGQTWANVTSSVASLDRPNFVMRRNTFGGEGAGYQAEIEIPLSLLGTTGGDFGVAFAVLNDFATCTSPGVCDGYGVSYPSELPIDNINNPVRGCMTGGWRIPNSWATGYTDVVPGDVFFVHDPYWSSSDIDGRRCTVVDNNWYNRNPCQVGVRSWLRNGGSGDQVRNVAYYWAQRGMGQTMWHFLSFNKGITVPGLAGSGSTPRHEDNSVDKSINVSLTDHPCIRAYILPPTLRPDFDESKISGAANASPGILTDADLAQMSSSYALQPQHSAQQNITIHTTIFDCPDASCRVAMSSPLHLSPGRGNDDAPEPSSLSAPVQALAGFSTANEADGDLVAPRKNPLGTGTGSQVLLSDERRAKYAAENVIVQIRGFAYRAPTGKDTPRYNFIEEVGGVIKMFTVKQIQEGGASPLDFVLGNTAKVPRVVMLTIDVQAPPGVVVPPLDIDRTPRVFKPGETTVIKASLGASCDWRCQMLKWPRYVILILILLAILLVMWMLRRRQPASR